MVADRSPPAGARDQRFGAALVGPGGWSCADPAGPELAVSEADACGGLNGLTGEPMVKSIR